MTVVPSPAPTQAQAPVSAPRLAALGSAAEPRGTISAQPGHSQALFDYYYFWGGWQYLARKVFSHCLPLRGAGQDLRPSRACGAPPRSAGGAGGDAPKRFAVPPESPRGAAFTSCLPVTLLLSPSPVSPASLVMLHTSLLLHIATGSYFPQHPAGDLRAEPGESPERSPAPQRGAQQPEVEPEARDSPPPFCAPPGASPDSRGAQPGPCLSFPPRSISKMCLGDFFLKYLPSKRPLALPRN